MFKDNYMYIGKVDSVLLILFATCEIIDIGLDIHSGIFYPLSRKGYKVLYSIACFGTIILIQIYMVVSKKFFYVEKNEKIEWEDKLNNKWYRFLKWPIEQLGLQGRLLPPSAQGWGLAH